MSTPSRILPRVHFAPRSLQPGVFCEVDSNDGSIQIHELTPQEAKNLQDELRTAANSLSKALRQLPNP